MSLLPLMGWICPLLRPVSANNLSAYLPVVLPLLAYAADLWWVLRKLDGGFISQCAVSIAGGGGGGGVSFDGGDAVSLTRDVTSATPGPGGISNTTPNCLPVCDGSPGGIGFGGALAFRQKTLCPCRGKASRGLNDACPSYRIGMGAGTFGGGGRGWLRRAVRRKLRRRRCRRFRRSSRRGQSCNMRPSHVTAGCILSTLQMFSRWGLHA